MFQTHSARIVAAIAALGLLLPSVPLLAATTTGSLIKGPGDAVYYLASDGRRYVFPTANAYKSWYADFSQVRTITAGELATYQIGGNVTYRPGARLLKVTTDPRTYAVEPGGVLRWVQTEAVAQALYGADWNTKINDVPDAFFVNYVVGSPIVNASDFSPAAILTASPTIDADLTVRRTANPAATPVTLPTPTPPAATSTPAVTDFTFTASKQQLQGGDVVLLAGISNVPAGIQHIELIGDGQQVKLCISQSCTGEFMVPLSGTKSEYVFEGRLTKQDTTVESITLTLPVKTDGASLVKTTVGQAVVTTNQLASVVVDVSQSIAIIRVDIHVGGSVIKACADGAKQCSWANYLTGAIGAVYPVYAVVTDSLGRTYTSNTSTITIGTNDSPSVTVSASKTAIYVGESVDVTATASDNNGIASIEVLHDGIVIKRCDSPAPCTASAGPFNAIGSHGFTARAYDASNFEGKTDGVVMVYVQARP